jgi:uncharacterized membrane protein
MGNTGQRSDHPDSQVEGPPPPSPQNAGGQGLRKTIRAESTVGAPAAALFATLADYERAEVFIEGLQSLVPVTDKTAGQGAEFAADLKVGLQSFHTNIVIESYEPDRSITWSSAGDNGQSLTFELEPVPDGTAVTLSVGYEEPGGFGGALVAPFVERTVRHRAGAALERLRDHLLPPERQ